MFYILSIPFLPLHIFLSIPLLLPLPSYSLSLSFFLSHLTLYPSPSSSPIFLSIPLLLPLPSSSLSLSFDSTSSSLSPSYFLSHLPLYPSPTSSPHLLFIPSYFLSHLLFIPSYFLSHLPLFIPSFHHPLSSRSNPPKAVSGYVL